MHRPIVHRSIVGRIVALASAGALVAARPAAAQEHPEPWSLAATASLIGFRGASSGGSDDGPAVRPSQGIAIGIAASRRWGTWSVSLDLSQLSTHIEAVSSDLAVQDRTEDLERVRLVVVVGRQLLRVGPGRIELRAGPALDVWSAGGDDGRTVVAGEVAVALQLPAGPLALENVLGFGWSPGPFHATELPAGYERESLRAVQVGISLRVGL